jgi:membrane associated rhomboid family serine protease
MAFLQSEEKPREPFLHAPASVLWLIGVLAAIHIVIWLVPVSEEALLPFEFVPARYAEGAGLFGLTVPLISHIFLHVGFAHLTINCLWLLAFGPIVARRYGPALFLTYFLACGVAGALADLAAHWGSAQPAIGASGAIAGLMAAGFRMLRWPAGEAPGPRLESIFSRQVLLFSGIWIISNVVAELTGMGSGGAAHIGGYLAGLFGIEIVELLHLSRARRRLRT